MTQTCIEFSLNGGKQKQKGIEDVVQRICDVLIGRHGKPCIKDPSATKGAWHVDQLSNVYWVFPKNKDGEFRFSCSHTSDEQLLMIQSAFKEIIGLRILEEQTIAPEKEEKKPKQHIYFSLPTKPRKIESIQYVATRICDVLLGREDEVAQEKEGSDDDWMVGVLNNGHWICRDRCREGVYYLAWRYTMSAEKVQAIEDMLREYVFLNILSAPENK